MKNQTRSNYLNPQAALREAQKNPKLVVETTRISLSKRTSKPCGVFVRVVDGPLKNFHGMIYIGDVPQVKGKQAADVVADLVNPAGQRFIVEIKDARVEPKQEGGERLKLDVWKAVPYTAEAAKAAASAPAPKPVLAVAAAAAAPEAPVASSPFDRLAALTESPASVQGTPDTRKPAAPVVPAVCPKPVPAAPAKVTAPAGDAPARLERAAVKVFLNGEKGGFHTVKLVGGVEGQIEKESKPAQNLGEALTTALDLAKENGVSDIGIVDPARLLLTTGDQATIRVALVRTMWLSTAKRKDARAAS